MNDHIEKLNTYFRKFINDPSIKDEIIFCLTQSQVELFIRFKFAFWISKNCKDSFSLIETNRIDLIVQIEGYKYCIEFGHQINLLKHSPDYHLNHEKGKVSSDCKSLQEKIKTMANKIPDFFENGDVCLCTISLFTNFHLKKDDNKSSLFLAEYFDNDEFISCGVLTKYGKSISIKRGENDYIIKYTEGLVKCNYHSQEFIKDKLSFHWKIKECPSSTNINMNLSKSDFN